MARKRKKKIQFSKVITVFILVLISITWLIGLVTYWDELDHFNYLLDYTQSMALGVIPYFCLSATDRMVYWQEAKNQGGQKNGMDTQ